MLELSYELQSPVATLLRDFECVVPLAVADDVIPHWTDIQMIRSLLSNVIQFVRRGDPAWAVNLQDALRAAKEFDTDVERLRSTLIRYGLIDRIPWLAHDLPDLGTIGQHRFLQIAAMAPFGLQAVDVARVSASARMSMRTVIVELRSLLPEHMFAMHTPDSEHIADDNDIAILQALARDSNGCPACATASYLTRVAIDWPDDLIDDIVSRNAAPAGIPAAVSAAHLVLFASREERSLGYIEDAVCRRVSRHLQPPSILPSECRTLRPGDPEVKLLLDTAVPNEPAFRSRLPVREVVRYARQLEGTVGEAIDAIASYGPLGAAIPKCDDQDLLSYRPDVYDEVALDEVDRAVADTGRSVESDHVTATHLMLVAARFGWPLGEAYDRLGRFAALGTTSGCERETLPEGIVAWQDILVMSAELDALEPALTGAVRTPEIERAAEAVREDVAVTRERIRRFAHMFAITLGD